jgi:hypothetical protein
METKPETYKIIDYLNKLWNGEYTNRSFFIINFFANIYYRFMNKFTVLNVNNNIIYLRRLGFTFYNSSNNEQPINNIISRQELNYVIKFKNGSEKTRKKIMNEIGSCSIFLKHKSGSLTNPENFRYLINHHNAIKILDRIWYKEVLDKCNYNLPDRDIFKLSFDNSTNLITTASNNTLSRDNVLLLDLIKAYDSLEWNIIEHLLFHSLQRKINIIYAIEYVQQYMLILSNRTIKYNNEKINVTKGISTGLPSSTLIFTFIMDEIIFRWMKKYNFYNNIDFILNIYIDDFYIKILNHSKTNLIISSLISYLNKFKLYINYNKSKIDYNLHNLSTITRKFKMLQETDLYLGIPFTRNIPQYISIILQELERKHKLSYQWSEIMYILQVEHHRHKNIIMGFMYYKLTPLMNYY